MKKCKNEIGSDSVPSVPKRWAGDPPLDLRGEDVGAAAGGNLVRTCSWPGILFKTKTKTKTVSSGKKQTKKFQVSISLKLEGFAQSISWGSAACVGMPNTAFSSKSPWARSTAPRGEGIWPLRKGKPVPGLQRPSGSRRVFAGWGSGGRQSSVGTEP